MDGMDTETRGTDAACRGVATNTNYSGNQSYKILAKTSRENCYNVFGHWSGSHNLLIAILSNADANLSVCEAGSPDHKIIRKHLAL